MARATEAQRVEQSNEAAALDFFGQALFWLKDPRRRQGVRYPLSSVVLGAGKMLSDFNLLRKISID